MSRKNETVCNIGPKESQNRLIIGIVMLVISIVLTVLIFLFEWSSLFGILIFFPLAGSFLGFLQAKNKTCIALAAQGQRNLDSGAENIEDQDIIARLKDKGNAIVTRTVLYAAILTALVVIVLELS